MKLVTHAFGADYYNYDVGVGRRKNGGSPKDVRLRKGLKRQLTKARRAEAKSACRID
jgi:hypothetical protein